MLKHLFYNFIKILQKLTWTFSMSAQQGLQEIVLNYCWKWSGNLINCEVQMEYFGTPCMVKYLNTKWHKLSCTTVLFNMNVNKFFFKSPSNPPLQEFKMLFSKFYFWVNLYIFIFLEIQIRNGTSRCWIRPSCHTVGTKPQFTMNTNFHIMFTE